MPTEARSMPEVLGKWGGLTHATPRQGSYTVTQTGDMYLTVVEGTNQSNQMVGVLHCHADWSHVSGWNRED